MKKQLIFGLFVALLILVIPAAAANFPTTTTLNALPTPLITGNSYSFSGQVSAATPVPDGKSVHLECSSDGVNFLVIADATTSGGTGSFSGTFIAPATPQTYQCRAHFPAVNSPPNHWGESKSASLQSVMVNSIAVPEFPTMAFPFGFIIGILGAVIFIRETKENN